MPSRPRRFEAQCAASAVPGEYSVEAAVAHSAGGVPTLSVVGAFTGGGAASAGNPHGKRLANDAIRPVRAVPPDFSSAGRERPPSDTGAIRWPSRVPVQGTRGDLPIAAEFSAMRRFVPAGDGAASVPGNRRDPLVRAAVLQQVTPGYPLLKVARAEPRGSEGTPHTRYPGTLLVFVGQQLHEVGREDGFMSGHHLSKLD